MSLPFANFSSGVPLTAAERKKKLLWLGFYVFNFIRKIRKKKKAKKGKKK